MVQICFAAWQAFDELSSEESWASPAEWQKCRDGLRRHFTAWSLALETSRWQGRDALSDDDTASLRGVALPSSQGCKLLEPARNEANTTNRGEELEQKPCDVGHDSVKPMSKASSRTSLASDGGLSLELPFSRRVTGDDSIFGPDGNRYEVFYPRAHAGEALDRAGAVKVHSNAPQGAAFQARPGLASVGRSGHDGHLRTATAEDYIGGIVSAMHSAMAARYPACSRLFAKVRTAVVEALGENFERMAMVGSAALQIDIPASDIDAVAFTKGGSSSVEALRRIAKVLTRKNPALSVDVVEYTRVPVLVVRTADGSLSLDLSVNQSLPEKHVQWFQSQQDLSFPEIQWPATDTGSKPEQSLEVGLLRCVKWWLWQRHVPVSKEGGYPTLVWTLMALHSLRCSVFVDLDRSVDPSSCNRRLLGALAAFFDRFAGRKSRSGTILFAQGMCSEFRPTSQQTIERENTIWPDLSVLDPALVAHTANGLEAAADLAPRISPATQLLYAFELHRAASLSAAGLGSLVLAGRDGGADEMGVQALRDLFKARDCTLNSLPTVPSIKEPRAALLLIGSCLELGILLRMVPRPGWTAPFLHRRDSESDLFVSLCTVDEVTGAVVQRGGKEAEVRFSPHEFVGLAVLSASQSSDLLVLEPDDLKRWLGMRAILQEACSDSERSSVEETSRKHKDHTCRGQRLGHHRGRQGGNRDTRLP